MPFTNQNEALRRLIFALDVHNLKVCADMLDRIENQVGVVKVGLQLFTAAGPAAVEVVKKRGYEVFLDLKLHDIPNTVEKAVLSARNIGVSMLTIHTSGGREMMSKAAGKAGDFMKILGVTLLTSMDKSDLEPLGIIPDPEEVVLCRAKAASESGLHGVVCSPKEIRSVRAAVGKHVAIVTPGIRPSGVDAGDQKRIATPQAAIAAGADYLVVGRPISDADDPAKAAAAIVEEIARAMV